MLRIFAFFLIVLHAVQAQAEEVSGKEILSKMIHCLESHQELTYDLEYTFRIAQDPDTLYFIANAVIARDKNQNYWNAKFRLADFDRSSNYMLCTDNKLYIVNKVYKTVKIHDQNTKDRVGLGSYNEHLLMYEFLHPESMGRYFRADKILRLSDTVVNGLQCYQVVTIQKASTNKDKTRTIFFINKKDHFPLLKREYVYLDGGIQFTQNSYTNYSFRAAKDRLSARQIPDTYRKRKIESKIVE